MPWLIQELRLNPKMQSADHRLNHVGQSGRVGFGLISSGLTKISSGIGAISSARTATPFRKEHAIKHLRRCTVGLLTVTLNPLSSKPYRCRSAGEVLCISIVFPGVLCQ